MPREIDPREVENWLQQYDAGRSIATIAREFRKDPRVVRRHIDAALLHRDGRAAQRRLMDDALRSHQKDLMTAIAALKSRVQVPRVDEAVGLDEEDVQKLNIPRARLPRGEYWYEQERMQVEESRMWQLLREHLTRDPLWLEIAKWKTTFVGEVNARLELLDAIRSKAEERTGCGSSREFQGTPCLLPLYPWGIYQYVLHRLLGINLHPIERRNFVVEADGLIKFQGIGNQVDVARAPGKEKGVVDSVFEILDEAEAWPEVIQLSRVHHEDDLQVTKVRGMLEELELIHYIPGRCALCRRLGI